MNTLYLFQNKNTANTTTIFKQTPSRGSTKHCYKRDHIHKNYTTSVHISEARHSSNTINVATALDLVR